jgi:hypothetical protein
MAIGYAMTKAGLDNQMGGLVVGLRDAFLAIHSFKALLDNAAILPDSVLQVAPFTYGGSVSTGEIKRIRDSFTTLDLLHQVSNGGLTVASAVNFWADAQYLANTAFRS